jgi:hypothetical protein
LNSKIEEPQNRKIKKKFNSKTEEPKNRKIKKVETKNTKKLKIKTSCHERQ